MNFKDFEKYKPRRIEFAELLRVGDWDIKIYTITTKRKFCSVMALENIEKLMPAWIEELEESNLLNHKIAFLIVHEAREGIWVLFNWWTGREMIDSKVYFSEFGKSEKLIPTPFESNALICIWELEVFAHERKAWIENILVDKPNLEAYLSDTLTTAKH